MENELKHFDLIERYFDNEMSESERIDFENRLAQDAKLKSEFEIYQSIISEVKNKAKSDALKDKLRKADREMDMSVADTRHINRFTAYRIAASVILIVGISTFFLYRHENKYNSIASAYWQKDNGLPVLMDEKSNASLDNAMTAYKSGNYDYAYSQLQTLTQTDTVLYYEGLCSFELKKDATTFIQLVAENNRSVFQAKAKYYLLLLYIKADKKVDAIKLLNELLKETEHPYREQILKLSQESYLASK